MQLSELVKPIGSMTDAELEARLFDLRHRRETIRPAAAKHREKTVKAKGKKVSSAAEKLLSALSVADLELLLQGMSK